MALTRDVLNCSGSWTPSFTENVSLYRTDVSRLFCQQQFVVNLLKRRKCATLNYKDYLLDLTHIPVKSNNGAFSIIIFFGQLHWEIPKVHLIVFKLLYSKTKICVAVMVCMHCNMARLYQYVSFHIWIMNLLARRVACTTSEMSWIIGVKWTGASRQMIFSHLYNLLQLSLAMGGCNIRPGAQW